MSRTGTKHYLDGKVIRPGDHVRLAGRPGIVCFVLDGSPQPKDWTSQLEWYKERFKDGFMLDIEGSGLVFMHDSNEDLAFLRRA